MARKVGPLGAEAAVWLRLGWASLCLGLGGASFSCPMRVSPQAGGQPHLTLTLDCKQPGVVLAVLLAAESSAHI